MNPLTDKVAFVTGSGRGLGCAIADRLAELGAHVAIHDIDRKAPAEFGEADSLDSVAERIARHGHKVVAVTGNVADDAASQSWVSEIESSLGPIDILVNAAGGDIAARGGKPVPNNALGIPAEDIRAMLDRNLIGTMFVCRAVCPGMVTRNRGSVVNIASVAAHFGVPDGIIYAVAKAGIVHWSRCLAKELRSDGVRVNVISPGPTTTARFLATRTTDPAKREPGISLDRYAKPAEVADAVAFLAGDQARFVNGQVLCVDGGLTLFPV